MKKIIVLFIAVLFAGYAGAQTKTQMKTTDLQKGITDQIAKNYPGYKIDQAYKVESNKVITYEVNIQKDATKTTLVYNDKGTYLKSEAQTPSTSRNATTSGTSSKTTTQSKATKPQQTSH
jgi:hypothetical protein